MKKTKRAMGLILILCISLICITPAYAADNSEMYESCNVNNYYISRYGNLVHSNLIDDNGTLTRAEFSDNYLYVETYDDDYNLSDSYVIEGELEYISGVHISDEYNYVVCAQINTAERDTCEIARVIQYDKTWTRVDAASICGANTHQLADAGSLRFEEYGNYLYIHTCHTMYLTSDGYNHQANMTIVIDTTDMSVTTDKCSVSNTSSGYVSHSFNQFIAIDESTNSIITVDHGDAYPRAIAMFRYTDQAGSATLSTPAYIDLFEIAGTEGDNETGVSVGDLIVTENNYIVSFSSIDQGTDSTARNVYLAIVSKESFTKDSVEIIQLTDHSDADAIECGYPYITDIGDGAYSVIWQETDSDAVKKVYYTTIDENGTILSDICRFNAYLSDCEPIFTGDKVIWYATFCSTPVFYYVSTEDTTKSGLECDTNPVLEIVENETGWEYNVYFVDDEAATYNIDCPSNVSIFDISVSTDMNVPYYYSYGSDGYSSYVKLIFVETPCTYNVTITLSDGQIIETQLIVRMRTPNNSDTKLVSEIVESIETTETTTKDDQDSNCLTYGDMDGNGKITAADARMILRISAHIMQIDADSISAADLNGDGKITAGDARQALRIAAHLI